VFPKIGGKPPKWMVKIMENPINMDDLGGTPTIFGNTQLKNHHLNITTLEKSPSVAMFPRGLFSPIPTCCAERDSLTCKFCPRKLEDEKGLKNIRIYPPNIIHVQ